MTDLEKQQKVNAYINRYMRNAVDRLFYNLEDKLNCHYSPATENYVAILSLDYISRLAETLSSQELKEINQFAKIEDNSL